MVWVNKFSHHHTLGPKYETHLFENPAQVVEPPREDKHSLGNCCWGDYFHFLIPRNRPSISNRKKTLSQTCFINFSKYAFLTFCTTSIFVCFAICKKYIFLLLTFSHKIYTYIDMYTKYCCMKKSNSLSHLILIAIPAWHKFKIITFFINSRYGWTNSSRSLDSSDVSMTLYASSNCSEVSYRDEMK